MCKKYPSTSEIPLCFEIGKCMLDSILITQFLESLMKFTHNLNGTESDNLLFKPSIPGPPKVLLVSGWINKFYDR